MSAYECTVCAYVYDEAAEGTPWADLDDDWVCPICGAGKEFFEAKDADGDEPPESATAEEKGLGGYLS